MNTTSQSIEIKYETLCIENEKEVFEDFNVELKDGRSLDVNMTIYSNLEENKYYDEDGAPDELTVEDVDFTKATLWSTDGEELTDNILIEKVLSQLKTEII